MAIEIKELIIRAIVTDSGDDEDGPQLDPDKIIEESVEQAMEIIKKKKER